MRMRVLGARRLMRRRKRRFTVVCILAPLGDLAESALKRDLGVKDMGSIMPGHGGALDRIDSALFVAPAAFYFLRLIL